MATSNIHHRGPASRRKSANSVSRNETLGKQLSTLLLRQREHRGHLTLIRHPWQCLSLFVSECGSHMFAMWDGIWKHGWIVYICSAILFGSVLLYNVEGRHTPLVTRVYTEVEWLLWWLILGILSSVGLGTGMHSGILFLFPYIAEVCLVAATCHTLSFTTYGEHSFHCSDKRASEAESTVTFLGLYWKIIWACLLWGAGTAIGEIPPYAVSLAAVRAGKQDEFSEELEELNKELEESAGAGNGQNAAERVSVVDKVAAATRYMSHWFVKMKLWMIDLLDKYGFWAVLAFAAWPNMAFDMCGIACGHFEMPFWKFFGATFIGKALIKVNLQAVFFIFLFSERMLNYLIDKIEHIGYESIADTFRDFMETQRSKFLDDDGPSAIPSHTPVIKIVWSVIVGCFITLFIASIIQSFAQQYQRRIDELSNEKWIKANGYEPPLQSTVSKTNDASDQASKVGKAETNSKRK